jgi:hypothetical protein
MKSLKNIHRLVAFCASAILVTTMLPIAQAQDEGPNFINLRLIEVHAEKVSDFEDLMKQRSEAEEAAGERFNYVFRRLRGVLNGYLIVSPGDGSQNVDVDLPDSWGTRVSQAIKAHTRITAMTGPSTLTGDSVAPGGEYLYLRLRTVKPGNTTAYGDWQENKLIPALRDLGLGDVRSARVVLGGNPATFVRFSFMEDFPALGAGPEPGSALAGILAEESTMLASSQNLLYRFEADLSFTAPLSQD